MSLTLARMRALLRKGLGGLDSNELTDAEADELLNIALWDLDNRFPFKEKECLVTASTVAGQEDYALPSTLDAIRNVAIVDDETGQYRYLREMTVEWYENNAEDDDEDERARPKYWLRRDDGLILWPIPDIVYTLRLEMWRTVPSLLEGTVDTTGLPRNWDRIVVKNAVAEGHFFNQDYNLEQQARNSAIGNERGSVLTTSKEEEGIRFGGLDVLHEWPNED